MAYGSVKMGHPSLDNDADGGMTHDNILHPDWHKGKDLPVNHTSNMSTETEFDKELDKILDLAGFQIFPASANKDREKAKQLICTREATLVREARLDELLIEPYSSNPSYRIERIAELKHELYGYGLRKNEESD